LIEPDAARLAVFASGRGSNLTALLQAFPGRIAVVISNKPGAPALDTARAHGVRAEVLPWPKGGAPAFEDAARGVLAEERVSVVLLAGFMRILSARFVSEWAGRMLNIHPSLLPDFPGLHAHRQALDSGVAFTGCTVHFVDAGCDTGEVILQKRVPVLPGDTEDTLAARLLPAEHEAYPQAVRLVLRGLAFQTPTAQELEAEFGCGVTRPARRSDVRVARLVRAWGHPELVGAALFGEARAAGPLALARATDELRLAWTTLEPLPERRSRWEARHLLMIRAEQLGLRQECEAALSVTADEWERTTY